MIYSGNRFTDCFAVREDRGWPHFDKELTAALMVQPWRKKPKSRYRPRPAEVTSKVMAQVKSKDSKAELILRKTLWRSGYRYRIHDSRLVGKPDIAFPKARLVVFVDGDFWHGHALQEEGVETFRAAMRTARFDWWLEKIQKTIRRDTSITEKLTAEGWRVLRFWESEVLSDPTSVADRVEEAFIV